MALDVAAYPRNGRAAVVLLDVGVVFPGREVGGDEGWWEDWRASLLPWGFDLAAVQAPVALWHGLADTSPPPAHSRWLAERIPHVTAHFPAGEDHTNVEENNRSAAIAWVHSHI